MSPPPALPSPATESGRPVLSFRRMPDGMMVVALSGPWRLQRDMPSAEALRRELETAAPVRITFDTAGLTAWDSSLLTFLLDVSELCRGRHVTVERDGLASGVQRLLALAEAVPERAGARQGITVPPWLARIGIAVLDARQPILEMLGFIGQVTLAVGRLLRGKARFRARPICSSTSSRPARRRCRSSR